MNKTPADLLVEKFGGHKQVAEILGIDLSRIYRWTYPADAGGTGGLIPQKHQVPLLNKAKELGIELSPTDFFPQNVSSNDEAA